MMRTKWYLALPLIIGTMQSCQTNKQLAEKGTIISSPENEEIITAQNEFSFSLFKDVLKNDHSSSNKLISPLSIYTALSMAYNGAAGETRTAMQKTMQLENIKIERLNVFNKALMHELTDVDTAVAIDVANSIWYRDAGPQPLPSFLQNNSTYYQAEITGADFGNPATVDKINNWVADHTHQKIKRILDRIDAADFMYLINAVYFKGAWKNSFDAEKTQEKPFHTKEAGTVQTPFMMKEDKFNYMQNDSLQMIELPYGNGDFNMYVLLPSEETGLDQLVSSLNVNTLNRYMRGLDSVKVVLQLPKWKYGYKIEDLKPELSQLGMGVAFSSQADFSNMYPQEAGAYISDVIHKAYIEVNEKGTEAAAVTSIGVRLTSVQIDINKMDVNRPFLYVIAEKNSGTILFMGMINNPAKSE